MLTRAFVGICMALRITAHMLMTNPTPYGKSSLNNYPLSGVGRDFPCKLREGTYDLQGASNIYPQGSTQKLELLGNIVHGGGSCQISISTDIQPDMSSSFKVIKSIEGGCPAKGQPGNMVGNENSIDPYTYEFTIPKDLAAGNYTLAWTWFNKFGNREMYMNCAPLTVTGLGGSKDTLDGLPDMFVANIGNGCIVPDSKDALFPNPGTDLDRFNGNTDAFASPTGNCHGISTTSRITTSQSLNYDTTSIFWKASSTSEATTNTNTVLTATSHDFKSTKQTTPAASPSKCEFNSKIEYTSGACSTEGEWNCIDGRWFQRCASGVWTLPQILPNGITCTPGQSDQIDMLS